jgi:hypothetical protein
MGAAPEHRSTCCYCGFFHATARHELCLRANVARAAVDAFRARIERCASRAELEAVGSEIAAAIGVAFTVQQADELAPAWAARAASVAAEAADHDPLGEGDPNRDARLSGSDLGVK